jgi:hypothetical protein
MICKKSTLSEPRLKKRMRCSIAEFMLSCIGIFQTP